MGCPAWTCWRVSKVMMVCARYSTPFEWDIVEEARSGREDQQRCFYLTGRARCPKQSVGLGWYVLDHLCGEKETRTAVGDCSALVRDSGLSVMA